MLALERVEGLLRDGQGHPHLPLDALHNVVRGHCLQCEVIACNDLAFLIISLKQSPRACSRANGEPPARWRGPSAAPAPALPPLPAVPAPPARIVMSGSGGETPHTSLLSPPPAHIFTVISPLYCHLRPANRRARSPCTHLYCHLYAQIFTVTSLQGDPPRYCHLRPATRRALPPCTPLIRRKPSTPCNPPRPPSLQREVC